MWRRWAFWQFITGFSGLQGVAYISADDILGSVKDHQIRTLLDLHDQVIDQEDGYWIKIGAWQVEPTKDIQHGIRYTLTLHAPSGKRILGYDNAHAVKAKRSKFSGQRLPFDHKHRSVTDKGVPYEFKDANQLLQDFFNEVDAVLKEVRLR